MRDKKLVEKVNKQLTRAIKETEDENNRLIGAKQQAVLEKTVATNSVSALTREIEWLRK